MEPIRVLLVSTTMDRAGAETLIMNIYKSIDRTRVQFDFILHCNYKSHYEDEIVAMGGRVFKLPPYRIINEYSFRKAYREFFKAHPEYKIIHAHIYNTASIFLDEANKCGLHTIAHSHNTSNGKGPKAWFRNYLHRNLYKIAEYRFACSEQAGKWLYKNKADFTVVRNGIDTEKFSFSEEKREIGRKALGISPEKTIVGHVGRFEVAKNHDRLIDIFSNYHKSNPDSVLVLVGSGSLENEIKTKVATLGLQDCVIFTGVRQDIDNLLCAMDVFLFPSLYEGLPVTLVEAQCTGIPCVVSDIITDEVDIAGLMKKVSLSDDNNSWTHAIEDAQKIERKDCSDIIRKAGYEIKDIANWLQNFYIETEKLC